MSYNSYCKGRQRHKWRYPKSRKKWSITCNNPQPKIMVGFSILMNKTILDSLLASLEILSNGKLLTNDAPLLNGTFNALKMIIIWNPEAKSAVPDRGTLEPS